jgi:ABC-2 type transport system ATP-binding protein
MDAFTDSVAVKTLVGYLPDEPVFYDFMRGRELIRFCGEMRGLPAALIEERSAALAERLQLTSALEEFAENYSRGMKKKLGLICAMIHEPPLLILDEPTNGLDPHSTVVLHALMKETVAAGRTVFFSTHLLDQAERLCDRVAIVRKGTIAAEGTLAELRRSFGADHSLEQLFFELTDSAPA